jgi:ribonuclease Z
MSTDNSQPATSGEEQTVVSRRTALQAFGAAAAAAAAGAGVSTAAAARQPDATRCKNPYGGGPGTNISLPPYLKPTSSVANASNHFPRTEKLGADEMRISFVGICPFPPRREQAGTSMMVELGNGDRLFFDLGAGCLRNIVAMQVPFMAINDVFLSHLHVDHFADLPYLYCFAPWLMRWKPLRAHGPSGRTPTDGTKAMIEGMKRMTHWHTRSFRTGPMGDGYTLLPHARPFQPAAGGSARRDRRPRSRIRAWGCQCAEARLEPLP